VDALLLHILEDEQGNGNPELNHSNVWRTLCHSVGFYPEDHKSRDFAEDPRFLDEAFTNSLYQVNIITTTATCSRPVGNHLRL
jgi:pyrroloquinoline quinone (PQQ) biosynthesis protein C